MATVSVYHKLSGSTNGAPIPITDTSTIGQTVHTAVSGTDHYDQVWLWASNIHTSDVVVHVEMDAAASILTDIEYTVPKNDGLHLVCNGLPLNNGKLATVWASTASVIGIHGYIFRVIDVEAI
jgi:hypothetical protein